MRYHIKHILLIYVNVLTATFDRAKPAIAPWSALDLVWEGTEAEVQRVKKEAAKSEEGRSMLERKARDAEDLASKCLNESDRRAQEAKVLGEELLKARHAEKLAKERLAQVLHSTAPVMGLMSPSPVGMSSAVVSFQDSSQKLFFLS